LNSTTWGEFPLHRITDPNRPTLFDIDPFHAVGPSRRRLLERGWAGLFRRLVLPLLPVEEIAAGFHGSMGRPSKELHAVLGATVLQQMLDLTDAQAVEAFAFDERWAYALNITGEGDADRYVSERTLRNYRRDLISRGMDQVLFERITDALAKAFKVDTRKQRLDSTHIRSNMRRLGRIALFAETVRRFLRKLKRKHPDRFKRVGKAVSDRYLSGGEDDCFAQRKPSESQRTLDRLAKDLYLLVTRFREDKQVSRMASFQLLRRLLEEQCEVTDRGDGEDPKVEVKPPKEIESNSLQNPSDPDATYDAHKGQGYQVQVMETYQPEPPRDESGADAGDVGASNADEQAADAENIEDSKKRRDKKRAPNLITHVAVEPAHHHDGGALEPALEATRERGCAPDEVLADTHYGSDDNVETARKNGTEVIAPAPGAKSEERLGLEDFEIDPSSGEITKCPEGETPETAETKLADGNDEDGDERERKYVAIFDLDACMGCFSADRCPVGWKTESTKVSYTEKQARLARRRASERTHEFRDKYRWRAGVEATMSHYKSETGVGDLRVRGLPAVRFAAVLKALGLNITRCAAAWEAELESQNSDFTSVRAAVNLLSHALKTALHRRWESRVGFRLRASLHPGTRLPAV
jgi:hypothetical protein